MTSPADRTQEQRESFHAGDPPAAGERGPDPDRPPARR